MSLYNEKLNSVVSSSSSNMVSSAGVWEAPAWIITHLLLIKAPTDTTYNQEYKTCILLISPTALCILNCEIEEHSKQFVTLFLRLMNFNCIVCL